VSVLSLARSVAAWDDEECKAVSYQHPDCVQPTPTPTRSPSAAPT